MPDKSLVLAANRIPAPYSNGPWAYVGSGVNLAFFPDRPATTFWDYASQIHYAETGKHLAPNRFVQFANRPFRTKARPDPEFGMWFGALLEQEDVHQITLNPAKYKDGLIVIRNEGELKKVLKAQVAIDLGQGETHLRCLSLLGTWRDVQEGNFLRYVEDRDELPGWLNS